MRVASFDAIVTGVIAVSSVMFRNRRLFHASGTMLALFPLIICFATSLSHVEGAATSANQRKFDEAQKIVGRWLRNESGDAWLADMAKTNSTPLTTLDLMNAIARSTTKGDSVWQAATTLIEALKSRKSLDDETRDSSMAQNDSWKNLIENIEMEDDIICLYRKNVNETARKADDWKKFLRTVSPGYTIHLAIDTGRKYVICLKKIDITDTTSEERSTTREIPTSLVTSIFAEKSAAETTSQLPMVDEKLSATISSARRKLRKKILKNIKDEERKDGHENCNDKDSDRGKNVTSHDVNETNDEDNVDDDDDDDDKDYSSVYDDSMEHEVRVRNNRRGIMNRLTEESRKAAGLVGWTGPITRPGNTAINRDYSMSLVGHTIPEDFTSLADQCKRPVILVVPNVYRGPLKLGYPVQKNVRPNPLWSSGNLYYYPMMPSARYGSLALPNYSTNPNKYSSLSRPLISYNSPYNKGPRRALIMKNARSQNKLADGKIRYESFARPDRQSQSNSKQLYNLNSGGPDKVRARVNYIFNPSYQATNYPQDGLNYIGKTNYPNGNSQQPRGSEVSSGRNIRKNHQLTFINRGASKFDRWSVSPKNIATSGSQCSGKCNQVGQHLFSRFEQPTNVHEAPRMSQNPRISRLQSGQSILRPQTSKSSLRSIVQSPRASSSNDPTRHEQFPTGYQDSLTKLSQPSGQNYHRIYPKILKILRTGQKIRQSSATNFNPPMTYPGISNFVGQSGLVNPMGMSNFNENCRKPCDRPIKLQILINGKIREPMSVAVLSESGEKLRIVGSNEPAMPHGSRALNDRSSSSLRRESHQDIEGNDETKIETRMDRDEIKVSEDDKISTMPNDTEITSVRSNVLSDEALDNEDRDTTTETSSAMETNETMSTTTNSTIDVSD